MSRRSVPMMWIAYDPSIHDHLKMREQFNGDQPAWGESQEDHDSKQGVDVPQVGDELDLRQDHLLLPQTITMMWFPASDRTVTVQPIAMFELGQCLNPATLAAGRRVVVGADPGYPRAADVALMMAYHRPGEPVYSTLDVLVAATALAVGDVSSAPTHLDGEQT